MMVIDLIKLNIFNNYFNNIHWTDIVSFILGIVIGFIFTLLIYCLVSVTSYNKELKKAKLVNIDIKDEEINKIIINYKDSFIEDIKGESVSNKIINFKDSIWSLIQDVAKVYYPNSKHPIFELTIDEVIKLDYYIVKKLETLLGGKVTKKIRSLKIVSIINLIEKKKEIEDTKVVKAAKKTNAVGILKGIYGVLNVINPVYWVKKASYASISTIINKIGINLIEIIGEETSNVYSKRVLSDLEEEEKYKELVKKSDEIDNIIGGNDNE